jgi:hypothetical protein
MGRELTIATIIFLGSLAWVGWNVTLLIGLIVAWVLWTVITNFINHINQSGGDDDER